MKELFYDMHNSIQETVKSSQLSENVTGFCPVNVPVWHMLAIEDLFGVNAVRMRMI